MMLGRFDIISGKRFKKQVINIAVLIVLIAITFYTIFHNAKEFSFDGFMSFLSGIDPLYLISAFICMFLFIFFEGEAINVLTKHIGYKRSICHNFVYSSASIYFSAITPSATGGQPASAYFMHKDGIPVSASGAVLSYNVFMYIASLIALAILTLTIRFNLFLSLDFWAKVFVIAGIVIQAVILLGFLMIMVSERLVLFIARFCVNVLYKLHIKKDKQALMSRLTNTVARFKRDVSAIGKSPKIAVKVFLINFMQRMATICISVFIFFGAGIKGASVIDVFALQALCLIGSNCVPIPGAVGVSEGLYLSAFSTLMSSTTLVSAMMATRGISYYICFIFAGVVTLTRYISLMMAKNRY